MTELMYSHCVLWTVIPREKALAVSLLTVGAVACKPEPGLFRNLVADMPAAAASNQSFHYLLLFVLQVILGRP